MAPSRASSLRASEASLLEAEVPSPCTGVCTLGPRQLCVGCGRTIQEIAEWAGASADRQRQIAAAAKERKSGRR